MSETPDVRVTERDAGSPFCPYCRASIEEEIDDVWVCPKCSTAQHRECVREHGRCVTHGCNTLRGLASILRPTPREIPQDREPLVDPGRIAVGILATVVLAAGFFVGACGGAAIANGHVLAGAISIAIALALGALAFHEVAVGFHHERSWIARPLFWVFERVVWLFGGVRPED